MLHNAVSEAINLEGAFFLLFVINYRIDPVHRNIEYLGSLLLESYDFVVGCIWIRAKSWNDLINLADQQQRIQVCSSIGMSTIEARGLSKQTNKQTKKRTLNLVIVTLDDIHFVVLV